MDTDIDTQHGKYAGRRYGNSLDYLTERNQIAIRLENCGKRAYQKKIRKWPVSSAFMAIDETGYEAVD